MKDPGGRVQGAIDMHCHFAPAAYRRRSVDCIELAEQARAEGMAGVVLKSHDYETAALAYAVGRVVPGLAVFGGLCLDRPVGGLNPWAMETACRLAAKALLLPPTPAHTMH